VKSPDDDPRDETAPIDARDEASPSTPVEPEGQAGAEQETTVIPAVDDQPTTAIPAPDKPPGPSQLRRQRKELIDRREDVVYNLGGLAFELHRHALLSEPVMRRRAGDVAVIDASVRKIDERLAEIDAERQARREERKRRLPGRAKAPAPLGHCTHCAAPYTEPEARFCWSCGERLERADLAAGPEADEAELDEADLDEADLDDGQDGAPEDRGPTEAER
jgi:hypothetical protein